MVVLFRRSISVIWASSAPDAAFHCAEKEGVTCHDANSYGFAFYGHVANQCDEAVASRVCALVNDTCEITRVSASMKLEEF